MNGKIVCQACTPRSRKSSECRVCGGYGLLLEIVECPKCLRQGWVRPGVHSVHEGKKYRTFDGMEWVAHLKKPNNCAECEGL